MRGALLADIGKLERGLEPDRRTLPEPETTGKKPTQRALPETLAEMYLGSSKHTLDTGNYSLFVFDIGRMDVVHKSIRNRFGESYRFISVSPEEIKSEIEKIASEEKIILRFLEPTPNIYGTKLKSDIVLDVRVWLGELEKKYR